MSNKSILSTPRTDGTAVPAGYIGEVVTWTTPPTTQSLTTTLTDWTNAFITLNKGRWLINVQVSASYFSGTTTGADGGTEVQITNSSNSIIQNMDNVFSGGKSTGQSIIARGTLSFSAVVDVSSDGTIYKIRARYFDNAGSGSGAVENGPDIRSRFFAVRLI